MRKNSFYTKGTGEMIIMQKRWVMVWVVVLMFIGLAFGAVAGFKPVAGTITFLHGSASLPVVVHVNVNESGFLQECIISPLVNTGQGGSFATNLDNLVLKDAPSIRCNGLWTTNNKIWYTFEYNEKGYSSPIEMIKSGTGLQVLVPVVLDLGGTPSESSDTSLETGKSGGARDASDKSNIPVVPAVEVVSKVTVINPKGELLLQSSPVDMNLKVTIFGRMVSGSEHDGRLRVEVLELPEGRVVDFREYEIIWPFTQEVSFDMIKYKSGQYKVQAIVRDGEIIVGASAPDTFTLRRSEEEIPENQNFAGMAFAFSERSRTFFDSPYVGLAAYFISFILVLTAMLLLVYKRRHYAHQIPIDELKKEEFESVRTSPISKKGGGLFKR